MINRVVLVGRLVRDPSDLRRVSGGDTAVLNFTIAVDNRFNRNNEKTADFFNCVAFNRQAEVLNQYAQKGSMIGIEGRLQTRTYEPKDMPGKKITVVEVVCDNIQLLESKSTTQQRASTTPPTGGYGNTPRPAAAKPAAKEGYYSQTDDAYTEPSEPVGVDISDDDLPF